MKTITVTDEAYRALAALKAQGESFTRLILRLAPGARRNTTTPLDDVFGIISEEEYRELKREHEAFKRNFAFRR